MNSQSMKEQIRLDIELAVQRRVAVSVGDRFGTHSAVFKRQFEEANSVSHQARQAERLRALKNKVTCLTTEIENKTKEVQSLLRFDPKKVDILEELTDRVEELEGDVSFEVDRVQTFQERCHGGQQNDLSVCDGELEDTLIQWRLDQAPRCHPQ
ncbi:orf35 [Alcelaphine gammaherpesvirus 2]|uniref:Orf35 n=1 Tax=Alcelaphine gammaherpesvirus 2 TaxID=138184 RepID=A0A068AAK7_9GAMA|nr:orf35 [Alcelaphine gammaherpesvirus 2]AIA62071.1 orf35 [Alcelaphine gammaherpesvirus 2]